MDTVNLDDAKACLDELVDRVEAGESIEIVRMGRTVARLVGAVPLRKPVDIRLLRALTTAMPKQASGAATLVRSMRDTDRY